MLGYVHLQPTDSYLASGLSKSGSVNTRKVVNSASEGQNQGKLVCFPQGSCD